MHTRTITIRLEILTASPNPNWPSKTGGPSGGGRGNNPPGKK